MENKILVETSARHVHLTAEHIEILFGKGATLTHKKDLSQPGQFACEERVTVEGPKGAIKNVIILGPARPQSQVEVSLTDARSLGVVAPVRESGDLAGSADKEIVKVKVTSNGRSLIFDDVVVRVSPKFAPAMHIDTDESNAACAFGEVYGEIIK